MAPVTKIARPAGSAPMYLYLTGELDMATGEKVRRLVASAAQDATQDVIVDLSEVTFVDAAGLRPLLEAERRLGHRLWLQQPSAPVTQLLRLLDLHDTFAVVGAPDLNAPDPSAS